MCGDILDAWPGMNERVTVSSEELEQVRERQRLDFVEIMSQLEIPLVCVCGNHDVGNTPTPATVKTYRRDFGDDFFSFWSGGVFFIVINSQYHEDASLVTEAAGEQEAWLEQQLEIAESGKCKYSVVFQHIPYFVETPGEAKIQQNYSEPLRSTMLTRLCDAGVSKVFCGHYHRNAGGWFRAMEVVVTSAVGMQLGKDNNGFRLISVSERIIEHEYIELTKF